MNMNGIVLVILINFLYFLVYHNGQARAHQDDELQVNNQELSIKLDKILLFIENLDLKYHQLNKTLNEKLTSNYHKGCQSQSQPQQPQWSPNIKYQDYPSSDFMQDHPNNVLSARDYFNNKYGPDYHALSSKLASINVTSSKIDNSGNCSTLVEAIQSLGSTFKDQLTNFRTSLNKLMARVWDQSYQFNVMSNQLNLVKDECSLSVTMQTASQEQQSAACSMSRSEQQTSQQQDLANSAPIDLTNLSAMRASQMVAIEGVVSRGLTNLATRVDTIVERVISSSSKLDELGSVVKHSALLLSKLDREQSVQHRTTLNNDQVKVQQQAKQVQDWVPNTFITLDYYNNNETNHTEGTFESDRIGTSNLTSISDNTNKNPSRWFPGSKIPNHIPPKIAQQQANSTSSSMASPTTCVKTKTSSVGPTSCQ